MEKYQVTVDRAVLEKLPQSVLVELLSAYEKKIAEYEQQFEIFTKPQAQATEPALLVEDEPDRYVPVPNRSVWLQEDDEELLRLVKLNYSIRTIAKKLLRKDWQVEYRLKRLRSGEPVYYARPRWTPEDEQRLIEYVKADYKYKVIAKLMDRSHDAIKMRINHLRNRGLL